MDKLKKRNARKFLTAAVASALCCTLSLSVVLPAFNQKEDAFAAGTDKKEIPTVARINGKVDNHLSDYFDSNVVQKLPDNIKRDDEISVIVEMNMNTLIDEFEAAGKTKSAQSVGDYAATGAGKRVQSKIAKAGEALRARLKKEGLKFKLGKEYNVLLSGFEVTMKASEFEDFALALGDEATAIVGEQYARCETQLVNNDVNVYDTGIFDSSDSKYDGTGTVIAVLDTGLDYTHSAFSPERFDATGARLTQSSIERIISETSASTTTLGLTAADVYLNAKVPYAYDYADQDPDVYPIASEHGTHVSGVIVGEDDVITGVAPNAQLVSMKVFSDVVEGARDAWLIAALEDCVVLEVDVINMSLGTSAGFSREEDKVALREVYEKIQERGISVIAAASNSYSSTFASEKNGNLGLTSNPDTSTIGSPSTYESTLSVASISGTKTPYLTYNGSIVYFKESTNKAAKQKKFVEEILPEGVETKEFEYVTIPGVGRAIDYTGRNMAGKIALVRRGSTSFEEKARVAMQSGAAGLIVYNNVSGDISMTVGNVNIPVCSISQDNGEVLAAQSTGKIVISRTQTAGPFMSDFSSWGPTSDLHIKPEITAHGGDIYSAVPGQAYDRMSGTSMATPNQAGFTALVRQYVKETFTDIANDPVAVSNRVYQLMMSTADIAYNVNGLPYSVRKQGAGLANLTKSTSSPAYVTTYDQKGNLMDKPKLELGDDPDKTGVYTMTLSVNNFSNTALSYNVNALVQTEGVSGTKTHQGDTTVTEEGYTLSGASVTVTNLQNGTGSGNSVTVAANSVATITVEIKLSDADKQYLDASFANGMYVEGYITLTATGSQNNLNVPYLAFYGDWTQAPIFDKDYYETNKDEIDDSIDTLDKNLPDAYATRPVAGLYDDYIGYLGAYPFTQNPSSTKIAADRKYASLSNTEDTLNSLYAIFAGMLRGAKRVVTTITDAATGEVIFTDEACNQRKSFSNGMTIYQSILYEDFNVAQYNLKNNTQYLVKIQAYLDYERDGAETNLRNTFEFPFVTDFEAPAVTDCEFYTEYDRTEKKTKLFASMSVYDNHYVSALQVGTVNSDPSDGSYYVNVFERYLTPVYSEFNTTNTVTYELTDYMDQIMNSYNRRSFVVTALDYAMNQAMYEITIPDTVLGIAFDEEEIRISPNETYDLSPVVSPSEAWLQTLSYISSNETIAKVVNGKLIGLKSGEITLTALSNDGTKSAQVKVVVLAEGDAGYQRFDTPAAEQFELTGYYVEKAYFYPSYEDRDISQTGDTVLFTGPNDRSLKMFPSESVTVRYSLRSYFPNATSVVFESSNPSIARVDSRTGTITAVAEGNASITVQLVMDGMTQRSEYISIEVKNPYETSGPYLVRYTGLGGRVVLPAELSLTEIQQFAFSGFEYVAKDEADRAADPDDPLNTKAVYIGENTITEVVIPEGVKVIGNYAFAGLTALTKVTLPSTIEKVSLGAFYGCTALTQVEGSEHIKFINNNAFYGTAIGSITFGRIIAIGDSAFEGAPIQNITLPASAQSIGKRAFANNTACTELNILADQVKLGDEAFLGCNKLSSASVNAAVVPTGLFSGCSALTNLTLGRSVSVVSQNAFRGTRIAKFTVAEGNPTFKAQEEGAVLLNADGTKLLLVAPAAVKVTVDDMPSLRNVTEIGDAAFSGNGSLRVVKLPSAVRVGAYAFANCTALGVSRGYGEDRIEGELTLGALTYVGDFAFYNTGIREMPEFSADLNEIGEYSFSYSKVTEVNIPNGFKVGDAAFERCDYLETVIIGDNVTLGIAAFRSLEELAMNSSGTVIALSFFSNIQTLEIGANAKLMPDAFYGAVNLTSVTLGDGAEIGDGAFYNAASLAQIDLSGAKFIGYKAFSGMVYRENEYATDLTVKAPVFEEIDLSACEELGAEAFMYCHNLKSVVLGEHLTELPDYAFYALRTTGTRGERIEHSSLE
ncbi:MAG: leucine-rich repeat protein, partial [Clostridiales bacterium]|nr:leucine-rich repeat protein [Clostridiales bacterium]